MTARALITIMDRACMSFASSHLAVPQRYMGPNEMNIDDNMDAIYIYEAQTLFQGLQMFLIRREPVSVPLNFTTGYNFMDSF